MKYGESAFDILYLLTALTAGIWLLRRRNNRAVWLMGWAVLILGAGDAFHLVPRVLNYFLSGDFTAALGIGKLVTSVTMTVFYVLLFYIWKGVYGEKEKSRTAPVLYGLAALRIALCLFPQNGWLQNSSDMTWGILRNVPFVILGASCACCIGGSGERTGRSGGCGCISCFPSSSIFPSPWAPGRRLRWAC